MRFKRRYFCIEIIFQDELTALNRLYVNKLNHTHLSEKVHEMIEKCYGDYGMAVMMPSFSVMYFNSVSNLAIVRTARDLQKKFHTLLTLIQKLSDFNVTLRIIHISGSIK